MSRATQLATDRRSEAQTTQPAYFSAYRSVKMTRDAEGVPNGKALARAREIASLYLKAPEVTRRDTRVHFIQPLKERIVREVGYGLSLEGASAAALVKSLQTKILVSPVSRPPPSIDSSAPNEKIRCLSKQSLMGSVTIIPFMPDGLGRISRRISRDGRKRRFPHERCCAARRIFLPAETGRIENCLS